MKSAMKMAGMQGSKPKGMRGQVAQAQAMKQLQKGGLPGGGGLGGFSGLQPAPKKGGRR